MSNDGVDVEKALTMVIFTETSYGSKLQYHLCPVFGKYPNALFQPAADCSCQCGVCGHAPRVTASDLEGNY